MKTETSQPKHTQGEWKIDRLNWMSIIDNSGDPFSQLICQVNGKSREEAEANAQRIVKCVNGEKKIDMHDELIEALKMANNLLKLKCGDLFKEWPESQEIERILKQAEGK